MNWRTILIHRLASWRYYYKVLKEQNTFAVRNTMKALVKTAFVGEFQPCVIVRNALLENKQNC